MVSKKSNIHCLLVFFVQFSTSLLDPLLDLEKELFRVIPQQLWAK